MQEASECEPQTVQRYQPSCDSQRYETAGHVEEHTVCLHMKNWDPKQGI
jgi:hypothetical protein